MPRANVNGVQLYYEVHGQGPALVFCHGADGNHLSWWQQIPAFMDRYRGITFDHRGFGLSPVRPDQPGGAAFVDDLEALLAQLGVDAVRIVGQSMGGRTALGFALRHPHRVKALVLADTTAGFVPEGMAERVQDLRKRMEESPDLLALLLAPDFPQREPALAFLYRQIAALNPPRAADFMTRGAPPPPPITEQLKALPMPVLLIGGEKDATTPPDVMRGMQASFSGARLEIITGAGHSAHFEQAAVFNRLLADFLDALPSPSA